MEDCRACISQTVAAPADHKPLSSCSVPQGECVLLSGLNFLLTFQNLSMLCFEGRLWGIYLVIGPGWALWWCTSCLWDGRKPEIFIRDMHKLIFWVEWGEWLTVKQRLRWLGKFQCLFSSQRSLKTYANIVFCILQTYLWLVNGMHFRYIQECRGGLMCHPTILLGEVVVNWCFLELWDVIKIPLMPHWTSHRKFNALWKISVNSWGFPPQGPCWLSAWLPGPSLSFDLFPMTVLFLLVTAYWALELSIFLEFCLKPPTQSI